MTRARYFICLYRIFRHTKSPLQSAARAMREAIKPLDF